MKQTNSVPNVSLTLQGLFWVPLHCGLQYLLWYGQSCVSVPLSVISMGEHSCPPCCGYGFPEKIWYFLFLILRKFFLRPEGCLHNFAMTFRLMLTLSWPGGHKCPLSPAFFRFSVITGPSTFLWASHLWVGRRQKPIFGCDDRNWFLRG